MEIITVEGGNPLTGGIKLSGARNSALKLIPAAMFSNEDVVLENVPRVQPVLDFVELIKKLGGQAEWSGNRRLTLNGSTLNTFEVNTEGSLYYRVAALLVAPLVFRFGRAVIIKDSKDITIFRPLNRWMETWKALGYEVTEDERSLTVQSGKLAASDINFKMSTHSGTDNAILSALFINGTSEINNAAEESEVEDLIEMANLIGGEVTRVEPRRIKVVGKSMFHGARFTLQPDKNEAVALATAALMTNGSITLHDVVKTHLTPFVNVLSKLGAHYEFTGDDLQVWAGGEKWEPIEVQSSNAPGIVPDWLPYMTLLSMKAQGKSVIYDTVFTDRFSFVKELNTMGAKIDLVTPSAAELPLKIRDDSYNLQKFGEPFTVSIVNGPVRLKSSRISISDINASAVTIVAALSAEGKSEILNWQTINSLFDGFMEKIISLGAKIY